MDNAVCVQQTFVFLRYGHVFLGISPPPLVLVSEQHSQLSGPSPSQGHCVCCVSLGVLPETLRSSTWPVFLNPHVINPVTRGSGRGGS